MNRIKLLTFLNSIKWFGLRKIYWMLLRQYITIQDLLVDQTLIKKSISRTLIETYCADTGQNINSQHTFIGFGLIHYAFVRNIRPKHILCIGSRKGFIPAVLAMACKDNHCGHVDFVDAGYGSETPDKHWSGIGYWKQGNLLNHFDQVNVSRYITPYIMATKQFAQLHPERRYQYIYIDGDHSYEGVTLDYSLFWPKLDKGGFMVFHDIVAKGYLDKGLFGVWKFWKQVRTKHTIKFPFPKDSGLGIIQK